VCDFLATGNMPFVLSLCKHFLASFALKFSLLSFNVGIFSSVSAALYVYFIPTMSLTATFWTVSISFWLCFDKFEIQTKHDCSNLLLIYTLYICSVSGDH
jgi:hypothetical protein